MQRLGMQFISKGQMRQSDALQARRDRATTDAAGLDRSQLLQLFRYLVETRRTEEHLTALYRQNKLVGGLYRSLGQEATAVGCAYALTANDIVQPLIRDMGAVLVHGVKPIALFRQYMARGTGPSAGRDLNLHFSAPQVGILGPVSMLGAMIPVLAGYLLAARYKNEPCVGLAFIGDGGSSTGAFYEGINFAAVMNLPMIVVIEANRYAYSTPTSMQVLNGDLLPRAHAFGTLVLSVDGNDVLACYEATQRAREHGLQGLGPTLIVADTYRRKGHAEHDSQSYVTHDDTESWEKYNDPLQRYEMFLLTGKHATASELESIRASLEDELNAARDQALAETFPEATNQQANVFDDGINIFPSIDSWFRGRA
jgi:TPP-dependent pyruvate/acetoin dehydrogenase alpha subunit